ncbi:MAG: glycosyltransferase family 2 protein [Clostridia bacterium]|nr:glycosyltransferase family 2 protein [Clostridia bacterium]
MGSYISFAVMIIFAAIYTYQFVYIFISFVRRPLKYPKTDQTKRYAVMIAARNEELVLPELLKSIKGQTYPTDLIDIYVIADNCTDQTAEVARSFGATVYERHNKEQVGKGYALQYLLNFIKEAKGLRYYDAYMVFDADNVLRTNYIEEMDKAYCAGNRILTSYRNSKNYGNSWVSAGYALWFMHEARHLNNVRAMLKTSGAISGTGFLIDSAIVERNDGWKYFLLTEDIEFSSDAVLHGERVGYCHEAELFDEQPETFRQSWRQRSRWAKGFFQVYRHYGKGLLKGTAKMHWACFDMCMTIMPAFLLTAFELLSVTATLIINRVIHGFWSPTLLGCYVEFLAFGYCLLLVIGLLTLIPEWRKIHCPKWKAILHLFTFPIFMMSYIPISVCALFSHVEWKPIEHKHAMATSDIEKAGKGAKQAQKEAADSENQEEQSVNTTN